MGIFVNVIIMMTIVSSSLEFFTHGHPLEKEPTCYSKFDYDAKLLERLLLVEHKMKLVEEKSEKATEDIVKFGEAIKQEADQASTKQTTFMDDVNANLDTAKAELVAQQKAFMDSAKATLKQETLQLSADQEEFIDGAKATLERETSQLSADQKSFIDDTKATLERETLQLSADQKAFIDGAKATLERETLQLSADQKAFIDGAKATLKRETLQLSADQKSFIDGANTALEATQTRINGSLAKYEEEVKKSRAVAFYALYTGTTYPGPNVLLPFSTAILNTTNVYDTQTGYFTAPTAGLYLFSVQICGRKSSSINFRIFVNNDYISDTTEYDADSYYHCTSSNAVAMLAVGDKVCVKSGPQTTSTSTHTILSTDYRWSTFLGVRLN